MTTPTPGAPQEAPPPPGQGRGNGLAIAGLVVGILALLVSWMPVVGLVLGLIGLVLAILGIKAAGQRAGVGRGPAIAGIVLSILAILVGGLSTACGFACGAAVRDAEMGMEAQREILDERAAEEGYADFDAWMEAEPAEAAGAQAEVAAEAGRKMLEDWGIDMEGMGEGEEAEPPEGEEPEGAPQQGEP